MLDALTRDVADLERHHGLADPPRKLLGKLGDPGRCRDCLGMVVRDGCHAGGEPFGDES